MWYVLHPFHIIFIIIFLFLSSQTITVHGAVQHLDFMVESEFRSEKQVEEAVSGKDEREETEAFLVEKLRVLLRLRNFHSKNQSNFSVIYVSPSPSPSSVGEPESPAPAPAVQPRSHCHPPPPQRHRKPPLHRAEKKEEGNGNGLKRRTMIAALVSTGASVLVFGFGFCWVCKKLRMQKRRRPTSRRIISDHEESKRTESKVSSESALDLFYVNSLGRDDLERQNSETVITLSDHHHDGSCSSLKQQVLNPEFDNVRKEIKSVHESDQEEEESIKNSSYEESKVTANDEFHSSDDESFHSFCDSHSSNIRLSNASVASLSDSRSETFCENALEESQDDDSKKAPPLLLSLPPLPPPPLSPPASPIRFPTSHCSPGPITSPTTGTPSPPQNPSKPPSIPPPPCPPSFMKGNSNYSLKTPPPPPQSIPSGKDGAPLPKLKPLHWDKVRAGPDRSTVWDKIRSSSFELDEEMIESLFGYNLQNSLKHDEAKIKTPSPSKNLLDPKRVQNLTILSKALNITPEQVCESLEQGDGLRLRQLEALVKMTPTPEEEAKLTSYKGDLNELGSAEKFLKAVLRIPYSFQRAEAMLFRETFEDDVVDLKNSFSMLEEACKELRSSRLFLKLLEAVLKTGNRMNVGTIRGGANAFKLDTLLKLSDVKGGDGKTTLLHFVVQEIVRSEGIRVSNSIMGKISQKNKNKKVEESEEDYRRMGLELVSGLSTELYNVKKTASIDMDILGSSVSNLSEGMNKLQGLIICDDINERFFKCLRVFLNEGEKVLKELKREEDKVLERVKEITEYFHGDLIKDEANPLRIFVIVRDFLGMLDHVCKELRNLRVPRSPNPLAPFR